MILVCAIDYFRKYLKMWKMSFFSKENHKKSFIRKNQRLGVFQGCKTALKSSVLQFEKKPTQNPYFLQKIDFYFLNQKIMK